MIQLTRQYAKLCDLRDFQDPELIETIRALVPERDPHEHIERKVWEYAMVMLFLADTGHLDGRSRVLSVGAGNERVLFWLTNHAGSFEAGFTACAPARIPATAAAPPWRRCSHPTS